MRFSFGKAAFEILLSHPKERSGFDMNVVGITFCKPIAFELRQDFFDLEKSPLSFSTFGGAVIHITPDASSTLLQCHVCILNIELVKLPSV